MTARVETVEVRLDELKRACVVMKSVAGEDCWCDEYDEPGSCLHCELRRSAKVLTPPTERQEGGGGE